VVYDLELISTDLAKAVRAKYGTFWRKRNRPTMPGILEGISISNSLTFATRVRIAILKEIATRHRESNPGLQCFVTNYLPRPTLKLRDKGMVKSFGYIEAVKRFGHHLSLSFLTSQTKFAKTNIPVDELLSTFLVLNPDLLTHGRSLDLSVVSNPGDDITEDQTPSQDAPDPNVAFSLPTVVLAQTSQGSQPSGKGEKRKADPNKKTANKKSAASYFG